ncbi:MAG: hypothetical protein A3G75_04150 [Verrucomicrobia bacterium RIFCSPLOWO2_12_FULL_64_8]|nr:MAG: hypothetical protein A3G75_04150 [Verrucomicrobia bacterium RIFCSPLOWO2_12_FULL_64_8]
MDPLYLLLAAAILGLALFSLNQRMASPVVAIFVRWLRWLLFSLGGAYVVEQVDPGGRPFWVVAAALFLLWFLGETVYNWMAISALSQSPLPLFPRYVVNTSGEEWPTHFRLLRVREWLRAQKFVQVQALRAEIGGIQLRLSVYQDRTGTTRLQVLFVPQASGAISVCYTLASRTADGLRYVTDNLYLPFGGFYPENWLVERNPWRRRLSGLVARHQARLAAAGAFAPWTGEPLEDINQQQFELERLNTELGFLFPHDQREEHGNMTHEGRFRVWREIWTLDYFGRAARYH